MSYIPSLQSEPTEAENQAQKQPTDDISHDTNDMYNMYDNLHTLQGTYSDYPPICYYCDYKPYSKDDYEHHVVLKHPGKPAYPNKAEIEKQGLKPQGKEWER